MILSEQAAKNVSPDGPYLSAASISASAPSRIKLSIISGTPKFQLSFRAARVGRLMFSSIRVFTSTGRATFQLSPCFASV